MSIAGYLRLLGGRGAEARRRWEGEALLWAVGAASDFTAWSRLEGAAGDGRAGEWCLGLLWKRCRQSVTARVFLFGVEVAVGAEADVGALGGRVFEVRSPFGR